MTPLTTHPKNVSQKKSFSDTCLERAEKAIEPSSDMKSGYFNNAIFIAHARQDVPELCKRLKRACEIMRRVENIFSSGDYVTFDGKTLPEIAEELEAMPEEK